MMRARRFPRFIVWLARVVVLPVSAVAAAASPKAAPIAAPKPKADPADAAHQQFLAALNDGTAKYAAKDFAGAVGEFQSATALEAQDPLAYYLLGEAAVANGDLPQAESAWLHATQVSGEGPPGLKAKIFFVMADLRERQRRWDDAKAAWEQYAELVATPTAGPTYPEVAKGRIASILAMQAQEKAYAIVRKRIDEERAKAAAGTRAP